MDIHNMILRRNLEKFQYQPQISPIFTLIYVRCKSGVTFVRRCSRDVLYTISRISGLNGRTDGRHSICTDGQTDGWIDAACRHARAHSGQTAICQTTANRKQRRACIKPVFWPPLEAKNQKLLYDIIFGLVY